jgi:hypothetical protein
MSNHAPKLHTDSKESRFSRKPRLALLAGSLLFILAGISALQRGRVNWLNWRGQTVFVSDLFVFAAVLVVIALLPHRRMSHLLDRKRFKKSAR